MITASVLVVTYGLVEGEGSGVHGGRSAGRGFRGGLRRVRGALRTRGLVTTALPTLTGLECGANCCIVWEFANY